MMWMRSIRRSDADGGICVPPKNADGSLPRFHPSADPGFTRRYDAGLGANVAAQSGRMRMERRPLQNGAAA